MTHSLPKICVVTGSRSEYGLLRFVIKAIQDSKHLDLQLIVTGMHLSPEFGLTIQEIESDGVRIDRKIEMLLSSDTPVGVSKSLGLGLIGFADAFADLQPDLVFLLGDRFEILAAASSALISCTPVAHCHGGELTEGAFDDAIRHSITKMSHLHFVATEEYRNRVIQLGEHPSRVFCVGGLGLDFIKHTKLLDLCTLEHELDFRFHPRNFLVTFHPVTLSGKTSISHLDCLLSALDTLQDTGIIFTLPNSDIYGRALIEKINNFCSNHPNAKSFASLGQLRYLSCVSHVDAVIGNSSSGLLEVPCFKKPTINIGNRQEGRLKANSVVDCEPTTQSILLAINHISSPDFVSQLEDTINPYGTGGASDSIINILHNISFEGLIQKSFFDIPLP